MADAIRMSGLVAARLNPGTTSELGSSARVRQAALGSTDGSGGTAAASLELGPGRPGADEFPTEEFRARQENILRLETRITALEDAGKMLSGVREGDRAAFEELRSRGKDLAGQAQAGPNLTAVLESGADPGTVDPAKLRDAEVEAAGALLVARSQAASERTSLARGMVAAENDVARQADVERVSRAAAPLRGQGAPEDLQALSDALKSSPMSRGRVLDLLVEGIR